MKHPTPLHVLVVLVAAACFLGGCNSIPKNLPPGTPLAIGEGEAVILATVTMTRTSRFFDRAGFYFKQVSGGGARFHLDSAVPWTIHPMLEKTPDPSLPDELNARLYAFQIPAGTYALDQILLHDGYHFARPRGPLRFDVRGGTVTYIGNLHAQLCHRRLGEGIEPDYVIGAHPAVTDRSDRDLPLLRARFPQLQNADIAKSILDNDTVIATYADLYHECPGH